MAFATGQLLCMIQKLNLGWSSCSETLIQARNYAARKSTRERKAKILKAIKAKKKAREAQEAKLRGPDTTPKYLKKKITAPPIPPYLREKEYLKDKPTDNVWVIPLYQWKKYSFSEAVEAHREALHPTMLDAPNSLLYTFIELDMKGVRKTKPVGKFSRMAPIAYPFDHGENREIAVFCKTEEGLKEAKEAGATHVFGSADIKEIISGKHSLSKLSAVIAHPNIMPELMTIKGLIRKLYPTIKTGTLSSDLKTAVLKQLNGIKYTATPYENYIEYGSAEIPIGLLDMDIKHLEENFKAVISDINEARPKRKGPFVLRICLTCLPNTEKFKLDHESYIASELADDDGDTEVVEAEEVENHAVISPV